MRKLIISALIFAALLAFIPIGKANAVDGRIGWGEWLIPTGQICLQTNNSTVLAAVAVEWNRSDADIVGKITCDGYPRYMTVKYIAVNEPSNVACAWTGSEGNAWTRKTVRGLSILTPDAPAVWINTGASQTGCRATSGMVKHVWSHEFGHVLGLAHRPGTEKSIMAQGAPYGWVYTSPTLDVDIARVNWRY